MDDVPQDPFAGDPDDPAAALGDDEDDEPLDLAEREDILADLADLDVFRALLEPQGIRGLVLDCADCGEPHYFGWDLLQGNLHDLLHGGRHRVHEPAYGPDPNEFVSWEYARGYVAGVIDSEDR